jgi:predicted acetyltransferase
VSDFSVRPLREGEQRATIDLLMTALHGTPPTDEIWEQVGAAVGAERRFGAFEGDTPIGITGSYRTELAVPGGRQLPAAAVDGVGVRADRTRRGILTQLKAQQFADCLDRGDQVAILHASETTIYGRFGYGAATRNLRFRIDRGKASIRPGVPDIGEVRVLDRTEAVELPPDVYRRIGLHRPGMIARPAPWWMRDHNLQVGPGGTHTVAVHTGADGDDGFVVYRVIDLGTFEAPDGGVALQVRDLHAADPAALIGLWRFLLSVDLITEIRASGRPIDDPIATMLTDPRACRVLNRTDDLWLRLLDVPGTLAARTFGSGEPVVLGVTDSKLPRNSGAYLIHGTEVVRTDRDPELSLDVETLAMLYLGEWRPSELAAVGRIAVTDAAALDRADELFRTPRAPWSGTGF